jgi:hypothetical protein
MPKKMAAHATTLKTNPANMTKGCGKGSFCTVIESGRTAWIAVAANSPGQTTN